MPQLDLTSFSSTIIYAVIIVLSVFYIVFSVILPKISEVLKLRFKLKNKTNESKLKPITVTENQKAKKVLKYILALIKKL